MNELIQKYVSKVAVIKVGGLHVKVIVEDVKERWGRTRFLVSPVEGTGAVWVESVSLV